MTAATSSSINTERDGDAQEHALGDRVDGEGAT
jgi:hypothetical protein